MLAIRLGSHNPSGNAQIRKQANLFRKCYQTETSRVHPVFGLSSFWFKEGNHKCSALIPRSFERARQMEREVHNTAFCLLFNSPFVRHIPRSSKQKQWAFQFTLFCLLLFFFVHVHMNNTFYTEWITIFGLCSNLKKVNVLLSYAQK